MHGDVWVKQSPCTDELDANFSGGTNQTNFSAGIDCSGFVYQAVLYSGSPYRLARGQKVATSGLNNYGELIQGVVPMIPALPDDAILPGLKYAIPGDILNSPDLGHVVIVHNLVPDDNGTVAHKSQVRVIQAGAGLGYEQYSVIPPLPWNQDAGMVSSSFNQYSVRRLQF